MLSKFPESKLLVPTLGGQSLFLVCVSEGRLKIVNSGGKTYIFSESEYNAIRKWFVESSVFTAFKTCNYTRTTGSARCIGWTIENGNQNEIYWGYLPAVFRELYARLGICVGNPDVYLSSDMRSYTPVDWNDFLLSIRIDDIINSVSYNDFDFKVNVALQLFLSAKNTVCGFLTGNSWNVLFKLWSDIAATVQDEVLRYIILMILEHIRGKIIDHFKEWKIKKRANKYPRRNCNNCPRSK